MVLIKKIIEILIMNFKCKALKFLKWLHQHTQKFYQIYFHCTTCYVLKGGKNSRGIRVSSYDPDESSQQQPQPQKYAATEQQVQPSQQQSYNGQNKQPAQPPTLGSSRKFSQKVSTISQNYNEKSMLLSSDEEYQ